MVLTVSSILEIVLLLLMGAALGYLASAVIISRRVDSAKAKAEKLLSDAENKSQDIVFKAKTESIRILEEVNKEEQERHRQFSSIENILSKKENELENREKVLNTQEKEITTKNTDLSTALADVDAKRKQQTAELQKISGLNREEAKEILFRNLEEEFRGDLYEKMKKLDEGNRDQFEAKAKEILTMTIQRYAGSHIADATTTVVNLPSDEVKGKIIGKEGRNIKTIERLTGVDVIIDDTPGALVVSGFDPVRRQVAKLTIEKLILDGRVHPAKIEEMVEKAKSEINEKIKQAGEAALFEVGVGAFDPKLTFLLGKLAFRTSFGQNVLVHSVEMAHVAGMLATELGVDAMITKKGALFHDIGKAVDHEVQGTHVEIGRKLLQKFNVDERVIRAMEAHHEEYPYSTLESRIVQAADAISGARPGARRDTVEIYLKRLGDLERIANSFEGVDKSYAIQAGRELRVFVTPSKIDDLSALKLARDLALKIESEMKYPGEIKVTVIRETRAIEYAR